MGAAVPAVAHRGLQEASSSRSARVFGGVGHYRKYHWLLTLSDNLGAFGVEHHECADDRVAENTFVDDDAAKRSSLLLPHEFFHSWNGKARRPVGLVNGGYEQPMKDDLLWVYEGLTNYYGELLARARRADLRRRNGSTSLPPTRMSVSEPGPHVAAAAGHGRLRAVSLHRRRRLGRLARRSGTDFYAEGTLIWLEADVTIRQLTNGQKTLDDFCALFHGQNDNGKVWVKAVRRGRGLSTRSTPWRRSTGRRSSRSGCSRRARTLPLGGVEERRLSSSSTPTRRTCSPIRGRSTAA